MLVNETASKLRQMKLSVMANVLLQQEENAIICAMSFDERLGMLIDSEYTARENNRLKRLIRCAGYPEPGCSLEDVEYHLDRHLDKNKITKLGTCQYVSERRNIIIQGATGSGKTYIASAFGMAANRQFYSTKYVRLPDLLVEFAIARAENRLPKLISSYQKFSLLILDEWLLHPLKEIELHDLLELVEHRYKKAFTIFCSQLSLAGWHENLGSATTAEAVLDRIVHEAHTLIIAGDESMRKRKGLKPVSD
jgi:DNA replication protein DnaC